MKNKHLRFVSWIAVSSRPQAEKESPAIQRQLNREYVEQLDRHYPGYTGTIIKELEVVGTRSIIELSEACERWPAYAELVDLIKKRAFDALIVRSRDRLGREGSLILTIERMCWQYDIVVLPRQSQPPTLDIQALRLSEGSGLIGAIESHFARSAVRRLITESVMGRRARVEKRGLFANKAPWGYYFRYDERGKQFTCVDGEIEKAIRWILLDLFVEQKLSYRQIATALNEQQIKPPKGNAWTLSSAHKFIKRSQVYAGYLVINREGRAVGEEVIVGGRHQAIISDSEWLRIADEIQRRSISLDPPASVYTNSVYCAVSGSRMTPTRKYTSGDTIFECSSCGQHHHVAESSVDAAAKKWIALMQENATEIERDRGELADSIDMLQRGYDLAVTERADTEREQGRILDRHIMGYTDIEKFDQEMSVNKARIAEIRARIDALAAEIESLIANHQANHRAGMMAAGEIDLLSIIETDPQRAGDILGSILRIHVAPRKKGEYRAGITRIEVV